jgi:UDP-N-acetylmuramoyl-tripeptide--D-alanyl-D-alanine ligase
VSAFPGPQEIADITGGRWLDALPASVSGVGTDTRERLDGRLFVALKGERFDAHDYVAKAVEQGAAAVMVERPVACGVPRLLVPDALKALQAMAAAWRSKLPNAWCVAITGSAGKTTVRRLVEAVFRELGPTHASPRSFNNHLGVPLTLLSAPADTRYLVVEIGMNNPGEIEPLSRMAAPRVAMVVNAGTAHLGGLGSREAIAREKSTIARGLQPAGIFVVHGDQDHLLNEAIRESLPAGGRIIGFGTRGLNLFKLLAREPLPGGRQRLRVGTPRAELTVEIGLPGAHNAMNAVGVVAALMKLGVPAEAIVAGLARVEPADMRMVRADIAGVAVFNDAYNANPDSVLAAVRTFAELATPLGRRVVALGDMLELGPEGPALHRMVGQAVAVAFEGGPPDLCMACGNLTTHLAAALREAAPSCEVVCCHDLAVEADRLAGLLRPGDALLVKGSRGSGMERLVAALEVVSREAKKRTPAGR